ncbi:MAG: 5'-3' exonuclease H3TH domain-containing protein [Pseudomonadota bacterium]
MTEPSRTLLVDASVYVFRAFHSVPEQFTDRDGQAVHAVYGFTGFLATVLERRPSHIAVCFDEALESSFRNDIYPAYKANREPAPESLRRQFNHCRAVAEALGMDCFSDAQYEADDLIGTLAERQRAAGHAITVVSSDKDLAQLLVDEGDELWDFARQRRLGAAAVEERFGVRPDQIADYLALTGDAVDNIPGVAGVGGKSAARLLAHFGDLKTLLERVDEVPFLSLRGAKSLHRKLVDGREDALLARRLTGISSDAPLPDPAPDLRWRGPDLHAVDELFDHLAFGRVLRSRCQGLRPPG